jgi:hypothetical protein
MADRDLFFVVYTYRSLRVAAPAEQQFPNLPACYEEP